MSFNRYLFQIKPKIKMNINCRRRKFKSAFVYHALDIIVKRNYSNIEKETYIERVRELSKLET